MRCTSVDAKALRKRPFPASRFQQLSAASALLMACTSSTKSSHVGDSGDVSPRAPNAVTSAEPSGTASSGIPPVALSVPIIDEVAYMAKLRELRPDLVANAEVCYRNLVLRPAFRSLVLEHRSNYGAIVKEKYDDGSRTADLAWMEGLQDAEVAFCRAHPGTGGCSRLCLPGAAGTQTSCDACPKTGLGSGAPSPSRPDVWPSGYGLCTFVGWAEGNGTGAPLYDATGVIVDWKVLIELRDYPATFNAQAFAAFTQRLADAGFRGDVKTPTDPSRPDQIRFQYNNVIIHGWSPKDAAIAERIADDFFARSILGRARGVDVRPDGASAPLDWHHFLCTHEVSSLSREASSYLRFGR